MTCGCQQNDNHTQHGESSTSCLPRLDWYVWWLTDLAVEKPMAISRGVHGDLCGAKLAQLHQSGALSQVRKMGVGLSKMPVFCSCGFQGKPCVFFGGRVFLAPVFRCFCGQECFSGWFGTRKRPEMSFSKYLCFVCVVLREKQESG